MKPRVRWCNECCYWEIEGTTPQGQGGFDTWQDAMNAANRWVNERWVAVQVPWGHWWVFDREGSNLLIGSGPTKRDAIARARTTLRYAATNQETGTTP